MPLPMLPGRRAGPQPRDAVLDHVCRPPTSEATTARPASMASTATSPSGSFHTDGTTAADARVHDAITCADGMLWATTTPGSLTCGVSARGVPIRTSGGLPRILRRASSNTSTPLCGPRAPTNMR